MKNHPVEMPGVDPEAKGGTKLIGVFAALLALPEAIGEPHRNFTRDPVIGLVERRAELLSSARPPC